MSPRATADSEIKQAPQESKSSARHRIVGGWRGGDELCRKRSMSILYNGPARLSGCLAWRWSFYFAPPPTQEKGAQVLASFAPLPELFVSRKGAKLAKPRFWHF
jgi:hypothetical protein